MKVEKDKKYICPKCSEQEFKYSQFSSSWSIDWIAYQNLAVGKCDKCDFVGEHGFLSKNRVYENEASV